MKPADEFYHIKSSSDGLASNCKACAVQIANSTRKHFVPEPTVNEKVLICLARCQCCYAGTPGLSRSVSCSLCHGPCQCSGLHRCICR